jgi:hypothetical protein
MSAMGFAGLRQKQAFRNIAPKLRPGSKAIQIAGKEMYPAINTAHARFFGRLMVSAGG